MVLMAPMALMGPRVLKVTTGLMALMVLVVRMVCLVG